MEKYGFVYIWYDKKRKMYYVGCHWGTEDDGYICSSKRMRNNYNYRPYDFKRRIIKKIYTNRTELLDEEHKWLKLIPKEYLGSKYYNVTNHKYTQHMSGESHPRYGKTPWNKGKKGVQVCSTETKKKMSINFSGVNNPRYGKPISEENRRNLSNSHKGQIPWNKGKKIGPKPPLSEEHKQKLSLAALNRQPMSDEVKTKISNTLKGNVPWNKGKKKED